MCPMCLLLHSPISTDHLSLPGAGLLPSDLIPSAFIFAALPPLLAKTRHDLFSKKFKAAHDDIAGQEAVTQQEEHFVGADLLG